VIRALVQKELREHRYIVLALWLLCLLGVPVLLKASRDQGGPLVAFQQLVASFGSLLALALVSRLVVSEYQGRTQLFLETLPVTRAQVVAVKWLVGAVLLLLPMATSLAIILLVARGHVLLTAHFVALIALRGFTYLLFFYALAFAVGFAGRYRVVVWGVLWIGSVAVDRYAQWPFLHWPPIQLVSKAMVFERFAVPYLDLCITWSITAALVVGTFLLALTREGAAVVALYGRMTHHEKTTIAALLMCVATLIGQLERRKPKPPFQLQNAVRGADQLPLVKVARVVDVADAESLQLAQSLAIQLRGLRNYLALSTLPPLFVLPDAALDSDLYLRATLPDSDGVVLRGALGSKRFDATDFDAFALAQVLDWYSHARANREERRWLLDGLVQWWLARDSPSQQQRLLLRAALASKLVPLHADTLSAWLTTREQLGDCLSDALAWRAFRTLDDALSDAALQTLLRSLFGVRPHDDMRGPLFESKLARELQRVGAPMLAQLTQQLALDSAADRQHLAAELDRIQLWPVSFRAAPMRGSTYEVRYRLGDTDHPAPPFAIRYLALQPWTTELPRASLARVDASAPGVLPSSMQRGARVFVAAEVYVQQLACTVRTGARRWELR
jgi:hypothetical protein